VDSGGGWSLGARAYGSVKGACVYLGAWRDVWSVADLYDEALGVTVLTT
jgi:streptogrisin C